MQHSTSCGVRAPSALGVWGSHPYVSMFGTMRCLLEHKPHHVMTHAGGRCEFDTPRPWYVLTVNARTHIMHSHMACTHRAIRCTGGVPPPIIRHASASAERLNGRHDCCIHHDQSGDALPAREHTTAYIHPSIHTYINIHTQLERRAATACATCSLRW